MTLEEEMLEHLMKPIEDPEKVRWGYYITIPPDQVERFLREWSEARANPIQILLPPIED